MNAKTEQKTIELDDVHWMDEKKCAKKLDSYIWSIERAREKEPKEKLITTIKCNVNLILTSA